MLKIARCVHRAWLSIRRTCSVERDWNVTLEWTLTCNKIYFPRSGLACNFCTKLNLFMCAFLAWLKPCTWPSGQTKLMLRRKPCPFPVYCICAFPFCCFTFIPFLCFLSPFQLYYFTVSRLGGTRDFKWQGWSKNVFRFEIFNVGIFLGKKMLASIFWGSLIEVGIFVSV